MMLVEVGKLEFEFAISVMVQLCKRFCGRLADRQHEWIATHRINHLPDQADLERSQRNHLAVFAALGRARKLAAIESRI